MQLTSLALYLATIGCWLGFVYTFDPQVHQVEENLLLAAAVAFLLCATSLTARPARSFPRPGPTDLAIVLAMIVVGCALWLPHFDNWRWAYTGDSLAWYFTAAHPAMRGLDRNFLGMRGVDFHFTYPHSLMWNFPMFVFEPNLFWHRVGKLIASLCSLTAIFFFVRITIGRWWALLIAICVAANFYLIRMSYVSYGHIDSFFFCFNAFSLTALLWRRQDDRRLWLLAGLNAGAAMFFTQTAWSGVAVAGLCVIGLALRTKRWADLAVCGLGFAICATPIVLQWDDFLRLISSQTKPNFEWSYLQHMARAVFELPYRANYLNNRGVVGGFVPDPLGRIYPFGFALAALVAVPRLRRLLRLPRVVPALAAMLAVEIVLTTLTNNGYGHPSPNRIYHLIPLQVILALVPFLMLVNRLRDWAPLHAFAIAATLVVAALYVQQSTRVILDPPSFLFGSKTFDGLIELHQRHDRTMTYFGVAEAEVKDFAPGEFLDQAYSIADSVEATVAIDDEHVAAACRSGRLVCCHRGGSCDPLDRVITRLPWQLTEYPSMNSMTLRCSVCSAKSPAPPSGESFGPEQSD